MEWFNSFQIQRVKWRPDLFCITGNRSAGHLQRPLCYLLHCQSPRSWEEMKRARQRGGLNGVYSSFFFLTYKQKARVDLSFLEFHTDNDVARIISALSVTGGGGETRTDNPTCINETLADFREYITDEPKGRNKDETQQTHGGSTLELSINKIGFCQQMAKKKKKRTFNQTEQN